MDLNYLQLSPGENQPSTRKLLHRVYELYREYFGRWFWITAPTSMLAAITFVFADWKATSIVRSVSPGDLWRQPFDMVAALSIRFGGFFFIWLLGCFTLGAIATVVSNLEKGDLETAWMGDGYQRARERIGALFLVAMLTFVAFLMGTAVSLFDGTAVLRIAGKTHFWAVNYGSAVAGYVLVAAVVSWFGPGIPLLLDQPLTAWQALRRSLKVSDGYEGYLFLLTLESLAGSYVGAVAVHYGLAWLLPARTPPDWIFWIVLLASALASAAVQPPMFIGFSLLACEAPRARAKSSVAPGDGH